MNKPFSTMKTNVCTEVMDTSTNMKTIAGGYLNDRYFQVLRAISWTNVRPDYSVTTVASTQEYALDDDFGKEIAVIDNTNGRELSKMDYQRMLMDMPSTYNKTGTVTGYYIREYTVKAQPSSASVISVVSSSASDTSQTVLVRGFSSGSEISESVTLTGTSAASTTASFTRVTAISKSAVTVGAVTVTSNSGAVEISKLAPKVLESRYKLIGFVNIPSTALSVKVPYITKPLPMIEDYDYPVIDVSDLIEIGAKADAQRYKKQYAKAGVLETLFVSRLQEFIWDKENDPNKVTQFIPSTYDIDNLY